MFQKYQSNLEEKFNKIKIKKDTVHLNFLIGLYGIWSKHSSKVNLFQKNIKIQ